MENHPQSSKPIKILHSFFLKREDQPTKTPIIDEPHSSKFQNSESEKVDNSSFKCVLGLKNSIWSYHFNEQDNIREDKLAN